MDRIIAFTGGKRVGKDTAANVLCNEMGYERTAFADPVKKVVHNTFGFLDLREEMKDVNVPVHVYDNNFYRELVSIGVPEEDRRYLVDKFYDCLCNAGVDYDVCDAGATMKISLRVAYQLVGTELFREYDKDFWVKRINLPTDRMAITDVRFNNEAQYVKESDGIIIEVQNPRIQPRDMHSSERGIDKQYIDFIVINNKDKEDLYKQVRAIMRMVEEKE